jgi:hypothetical protein
MPSGGGKRVGSGRTDVIPSEDGKAGFTAPGDWYATYANAGGFGESVRAGASNIVIK